MTRTAVRKLAVPLTAFYVFLASVALPLHKHTVARAGASHISTPQGTLASPSLRVTAGHITCPVCTWARVFRDGPTSDIPHPNTPRTSAAFAVLSDSAAECPLLGIPLSRAPPSA